MDGPAGDQGPLLYVTKSSATHVCSYALLRGFTAGCMQMVNGRNQTKPLKWWGRGGYGWYNTGYEAKVLLASIGRLAEAVDLHMAGWAEGGWGRVRGRVTSAGMYVCM